MYRLPYKAIYTSIESTIIAAPIRSEKRQLLREFA